MDRLKLREELHRQTQVWKNAKEVLEEQREILDGLILAAREAGIPFAEIREITGFGTATIQMTIAKAGAPPAL